MKKKLNDIIPSYAVIPLLTALLMNFITYNGTQIITNEMVHHNMSIFIDKWIPFLPVFVVFYVLAYLQWVVGYIVIARENKETCYHYLSAELIAKMICLVCFIVVPATLVRPEITGNNFFEGLTKIIYFFDSPANLFPSIHCLESWMCFRGSLPLKKVPKWYKISQFIMTIFVCMSTVFLKQHVFVDIIGGILVVEIGLWIAKKFHSGQKYEKIVGKLFKKVKNKK